MKARREALGLDAEERPREAAAAYEKAIEDADPGCETYLNLAVLYWISTNFGFAAHHKLENAFLERAGYRYHEVLDECERRLGPYNEIEFWRYYFDYVSLGEPAQPAFCKSLAEKGPSLVPYFHLFDLSGGQKYHNEALELLALFAQQQTERARYICSLLDAARDMAK